jgi:hypothetical protein
VIFHRFTETFPLRILLETRYKTWLLNIIWVLKCVQILITIYLNANNCLSQIAVVRQVDSSVMVRNCPNIIYYLFIIIIPVRQHRRRGDRITVMFRLPEKKIKILFGWKLFLKLKLWLILITICLVYKFYGGSRKKLNFYYRCRGKKTYTIPLSWTIVKNWATLQSILLIIHQLYIIFFNIICCRINIDMNTMKIN